MRVRERNGREARGRMKKVESRKMREVVKSFCLRDFGLRGGVECGAYCVLRTAYLE